MIVLFLSNTRPVVSCLSHVVPTQLEWRVGTEHAQTRICLHIFAGFTHLTLDDSWWTGSIKTYTKSSANWCTTKNTVDGTYPAPVEVDGLSSLTHYLQGFIHPRWFFRISEPSTVSTVASWNVLHWTRQACARCVVFMGHWLITLSPGSHKRGSHVGQVLFEVLFYDIRFFDLVSYPRLMTIYYM